MANSNAKGQRVYVTNAGDITATLTAGDIEIGAVEMKNAATDDRALIAAAGGTPTFALATLPAVANSAAPTHSEAKAHYLSTDLTGNVRSVLKAETTKVIGTVNIAASQSVGLAAGVAAIGSTTDGGASWTTVFGVSGARFTSADQSAGVASVTDAPTSGQKLVITDIEVSVDTAMRVDFLEETTGTVISSIYMAENSTVNLITRSKRKLATANKKLQVQTSAVGNISVVAYYYSEA